MFIRNVVGHALQIIVKIFPSLYGVSLAKLLYEIDLVYNCLLPEVYNLSFHGEYLNTVLNNLEKTVPLEK